MPYDVVKRGGLWLHVADVWLDRARREGIEPLVTFSHSFEKRRQFQLPSVRGYAARVAEFRARYPWVNSSRPGTRRTTRAPSPPVGIPAGWPCTTER